MANLLLISFSFSTFVATLGLLPVIAIAFLIGLTPHYLFNGYMNPSRPWFVGSFTIGMAAAEVVFSQQPQLRKLNKSLPWGKLAGIFAGIAIIAEWKKFGVDAWVCETFASIAAACLIVYCTKIAIERKTPPLIMRVFEHPIAIALSTFSYSLYLTHGPIETLINHWLVTLNMAPVMFAVTLYLLSVGISLIFAYVFYLAFERPFMSGFLKKRKVKDVLS
jgi:peptidoglycan/LPS O-acetylase OafA/YrhL